MALGEEAVWCEIMALALRNLPKMHGKTANHWRIERHQVVMALRSICSEFGDNDWPAELNLADVLEKHLRRHLER